MRLILAAAILLAGLKAAASAPNHEDAGAASNVTPVAATGAPEQALGMAGRATVAGAPAAGQADSAHDQEEEAADSSQPSSAAGTAGANVHANANVDFEEDIISSLGALCKALFASARDNDLPVPFFANLIWQESRFRYDAVSQVGAQGIAQFMPRVAAEVGLADPFDPRQAIPASARLLHELREQFSNLGFVAAAYNAGARRVMDWLEHRGGLPRETRIYVVRVTGRSIEDWQTAPPDDFSLTFVRPLPCRQLPAFTDLEQTQAQQAASTTGASVQHAQTQHAQAQAAQVQRGQVQQAQVQQAQMQQALPSQREVAQRREELVLRAHRLFGVRRHAPRMRLEVVHIIIHIRGDHRREARGHHTLHERRRVA